MEYRYDEYTRFEGGNEYLFFDTKDIRITGSNVGSVELNRLYESYLNTNFLRRGYPYSFNSDINGDFFIRTIEGMEDEAIEADYSWVHFSLSAPKFLEDRQYGNGRVLIRVKNHYRERLIRVLREVNQGQTVCHLQPI